MATSAQPTSSSQFFHAFDRSSPPAGMTFPVARNVSIARDAASHLRVHETREELSPAVFLPANGVKRHAIRARGITIEIVEGAGKMPVKSHVKASGPVLIAYERGLRGAGTTAVAGLPEATARDLTRKLSFVSEGNEYRERHEPLFDLSAVYIYFDPLAVNDTADTADTATHGSWSPSRLLFEDAAIWDTVVKIKAAAQDTSSTGKHYLESLGQVLAHEIMRAGSAKPEPAAPSRGGLAPWQQRKVAAYIEEHFGEPVTVADMADLVDLSTYYFCRAFKQSFGVSPHRYLANRRIEHAKRLLIEHRQSITHIALEVGFDETSSFSAAFRKATGLTPTSYQRTAGQ